MENNFEIYEKNVLTDEILKSNMSPESYKKYQKAKKDNLILDEEVLKEIANVMKNWALDNGATSYSHWFFPLNGITAEKQISFLTLNKNSKIILEFPIEALNSGEADASSFPNGGLRSVFEARGVTKWDYTFPTFLKEDDAGKVLCIPTILSSIKGECLDKRTPLLNSCKALSDSALKLLKLFGDKSSKKVSSNVGAEQEYFLIKKEFFDKRKDLKLTGHTLFGAEVPFSMTKHYLKTISEETGKFMNKVEEKLWKLGVPIKTKHNEVAFHQYEIVPQHEDILLATNHDYMIMEILKKEASKMGFAAILHEKPFKGMSGSGKHNNWSLVSDSGDNLFTYGNTPLENARFITLIVSLLRAINRHSDLIRATIATASNDLRLCGYEAPVAIISVYLGEQLTNVLEKVANNTLKLGKETIKFETGFTTDRNRTSPFAFVGNRFEFRMPGSNSSIAVCNTVFNAIMAESIDFVVENLAGSKNFYEDLQKLLQKMIDENKNIIYNGNSYDEKWPEEAEKKKLSNIRYAFEAFEAFKDKKSIELFTKYNIYSEKELESRYNIKMRKYIDSISADAEILIDMLEKNIMPSTIKYLGDMLESLSKFGNYNLSCFKVIQNKVQVVDNLLKDIDIKKDKLRLSLLENSKITDLKLKAKYTTENILEMLLKIRIPIDDLEKIMPKEYFPYPCYDEMLLDIK